jgi:hypothetical protein
VAILSRWDLLRKVYVPHKTLDISDTDVHCMDILRNTGLIEVINMTGRYSSGVQYYEAKFAASTVRLDISFDLPASPSIPSHSGTKPIDKADPMQRNKCYPPMPVQIE